MKDSGKTKKELIEELEYMRKRLKQHESAKEDHILQELSYKLTDVLTPHEISKILAETSRYLFAHDAFWISLYNPDDNILTDHYIEDTLLGENQPTEFPVDNSMGINEDWTYKEIKKPRLINRAEEPTETEFTPFGFEKRLTRSLMFVPIRWKKKFVGTLSAQSYVTSKYNKKDLKMLQVLADLCGGAFIRVLAEETLKRERNLFRTILDTLPNDIFAKDINSVFQYCNLGCIKHLRGKSAKDILGKTDLDFFPKEIAEEKLLEEQQIIKTNQGFNNKEMPVKDEFGRIKWNLSTKVPWYDSEGNIIGIVGLNRDITYIKQAEEALRISEEKYRTLVENANDGIVIIQDKLVVFANKQLEDMTGRRLEEVINTLFLNYIDPDFVPDVIQKYDRLMSGVDRFQRFETVLLHKNGSKIPVESNNSTTIYEGRKAMLVLIRDITQQKQAEDEVRKLEEQYRLVVENANEIITITQDGKIQYVNPKLSELSGYSMEEIESTPFIKLVHPDDQKKIINFQPKILAGDISSKGYVFRYICKDGSIKWVESHATLINYKGRPAILAFTTDITDRILSEEALWRNEERFKAQYKGVPLPTYSWQRDKDDFILVDYNDAAEDITNGGITDYLGIKLSEMYGDIPEIISDFNQCYNEKITIKRELDYSFRSTTKKSHLDISYTFVPPDMVMVHTKDITEERKAEKALRESEENFRALAENAIDAILIATDHGRHVYANQRAAEIAGYSTTELLNITIKDLAHPDEYKMIIDRYKRRLGGEDMPKQYETKITRKDGNIIPIEISGAKTLWHGKPADMVIFRDITERKQVEARILSYQEQLRSMASEVVLTEERERRRIATEIHDRIGQSLAMSRIILGGIGKSESPAAILKEIDEVKELIEQTIQDTRSLTFDLSPPILYDLGFEPAVEWLVEHIEEQYSIKAVLVNDKNPKPLSDDIKILLFQVVRELLMNVVKHSKAKNVMVSISKVSDKIKINVEDDGIGFDTNHIDSNSKDKKGFGLFSIRERLNNFEGKFEIISRPGKGTCVILEAPIKINPEK